MYSHSLNVTNSDLSFSQIFNAIKACLEKAEALAIIGTTTDFYTHRSYVAGNYLWALSDIIQDAKRLCDCLKT